MFADQIRPRYRIPIRRLCSFLWGGGEMKKPFKEKSVFWGAPIPVVFLIPFLVWRGIRVDDLDLSNTHEAACP